MENLSLYTQLESLPSDLKKEVLDFIEFLKFKMDREPKSSKNRQFGVLKGKISMTNDFDEPLEDFKEYM
ncbi:DUF2281 domain-containing protein [uncultured Arcticibacterium sp.]|uniref:type II toxin-antitoxin system VapB family antitoxin n=1 Tax=uncultured Arcticibacterium sp. TaxID=2173042 RepID=UPI0030F6814F